MTRFKRALLFGAAGQLGGVMGNYLEQTFDTPFSVTRLTRRDVDVTDVNAVTRTIEKMAPALIVNCSAYNDVDGAEDDAARALAVNAFAVREMALAAARSNSILVHYSTDFVFDGNASEPYGEAHRPLPLSIYGASKLLGEWFAASAPRHYVVRVASLFGGPQARSSIDRILVAIEAGKEARVFHDRLATPSYVEDVAAATGTLLKEEAAPGVYHCVNSGAASWYEIGRWLAHEAGADERLLRPVSAREVTMRAARPVYCALSNAKLARAGHDMPDWQDAVRRYLDRRAADRSAATAIRPGNKGVCSVSETSPDS